MIRLLLSISLPLTSVAVLADVQIDTRGNIYIPPCTVSNGQNIVVGFGNINPKHVDNSHGEVARITSISCPHENGSLWIRVMGNTMGGGQNSVLATNITYFDIALYQGKGMPTPLILGNDSGSDYRVAAGLDTTRSTFTSTSVPSRDDSGILSGGDFRATTSVSMIYN